MYIYFTTVYMYVKYVVLYAYLDISYFLISVLFDYFKLTYESIVQPNIHFRTTWR